MEMLFFAFTSVWVNITASYLIIDIEPLRVMVHLFCLQGYSGHETKRLKGIKHGSYHTRGPPEANRSLGLNAVMLRNLVEVFKDEFFVNGIPAHDLHPLSVV